MQPNLTLRNGEVIPLTDEIYEAVLRVVENEKAKTAPAGSIEELEEEFAELFAAAAKNGPTLRDLTDEHRQEIERERRKSENFR